MVGFRVRYGISMNRRGPANIVTRFMRHGGFLLILLSCLLIPLSVHAQDRGTVAVLPFKVNAPEDLDHLREGLQKMFVTRMAGKGLSVIPPETVNKHPMAFRPTLTMEDIRALGRDIKSDLVITGSLTQIGSKVSLDLTVVDIQISQPPFSVFVVEDDVEKLADAADKATKSLYNRIAGVEQIDSLEVKGNRRVEGEAILSVVDSRKGEALDYDQLDKDLRSIYAMKFFKDVKIETRDGGKGKIVIFVVSEKSSIGTIVFKGNKKIKEKDLKEEVGIKRYAILNLNEIKQSINRLKEVYRQKGFYNVDIRERIEDLPENEVALTYEIDEGEKVFIEKIEFVGNSKYDDDDLRDLMETREKGFFSWFTKSGLLDKKKLEFDIQKVSAFYHNHGFIKAKTGEPKVTYEEGKGLTIITEIIEGPQYEVHNVTVAGDLVKPPEELLEKVNIKKEQYFNREIVRKDTQLLREVYANEGYAYVDVAAFTKQDDENHLVDITYKMSKGEKVRLERINIAGNTVTRDNVIRRELQVVEGDYFSGKGMKKSTENLNRLGYFENIEIQPKKGESEDLMVLDIDVKERATGSFSVGAGYSSYDKVLGSFMITERNFRGKGQTLSGQARLGAKTTEFDIRFIEPWLFGKRLKMGVDIFNWEREYDEYTKDSLGGALRFGFPLGFDEYTEGLVKYRYDNADISDIEDTAALAIKEMEGRNVTSSLRFGIERDSRDRPWNTSRGSENDFNFEYAGGLLGGDVAFNRYELKSAWYFPVWWETVIKLQGRWGFIDNRPQDGKLPIYQKYFLGGINTVRGFEYQDISPRDPATGDKIGGEKMMVFNLEYRFPLYKEQGVIGLVFMDAGNVFGKEDSYSFSGLKKSFGTGVRWYSPMGPIRVEYGWVISPEEGEPSGNMDFSIGGVF